MIFKCVQLRVRIHFTQVFRSSDQNVSVKRGCSAKTFKAKAATAIGFIAGVYAANNRGDRVDYPE
jgi:hypothetical protein